MSETELKARELYAAALRANGMDFTAERVLDMMPAEGVAGSMRATIDAIKAALAPQWQPIERAPKDGTAILLTNGKDVAEGHWYFEEGGTTEHRDLDGRYIDQTESDGYDGWLDWEGGMQPDPTHWMPLPAPPEVEG